MDLTQDECLRLWHYRDGVLYWNEVTGKRSKNGIKTNINGYIFINYNYKQHYAHRVIYIMHYGKIPANTEIDHINHKRNDNKINNLRAVKRIENRRNSKLPKSNTSGFIGVMKIKNVKTPNGKLYFSQIVINYKYIRLGCFKTIEEAITARKQANIKYGFHENHGLETVDNSSAM